MTETHWLLIVLASASAGAVNAIAGGGTLITFPVLTAVGLPAIVANITNSVALCPGYLAATVAQSGQLRGQGKRLFLYLPVGLLGGIAGGALLLNTEEALFRKMVPFLILFACGLMAAQEFLRAWLLGRWRHPDAVEIFEKLGLAPAFLASVYGGYFGAGVSVIVLAVFSLMLEDTLTRLNALKQAIAFAINLSAALYFACFGQVDWPVALVMTFGALMGGALGGKLADRLKPAVLRTLVVFFGIVAAGIYLDRGF